jgi:hypothetical protein
MYIPPAKADKAQNAIKKISVPFKNFSEKNGYFIQ